MTMSSLVVLGARACMSSHKLIGAGFAAVFLVVSQPALAQAPAVPAEASAPAAKEYRLGAGDVVRITVFQNQDLTLETRITEAGLVSYPLLGSLRLGGETVTSAERLIADGLLKGNFVRNPQVTMVVLQVRGNQASVLGQVNRPGRFPLELADMRLTDLLALAGGTASSGADKVVITGTRSGKAFRQEVDLPSLFAPGGASNDLFILNGEVQRPGPMRLEREMTLLQTLATGGGLTQRGTAKGIVVHRRGGAGKVDVITPEMTDLVREGDVVFVRESLF